MKVKLPNERTPSLMQKNRSLLSLSSLLLLSFFVSHFTSCKPDNEEDAELYFSTNIVTFDTIFTSLSSVIRTPFVYNTSSKDLIISSIKLCGGKSSRYRININGDTNLIIRNLRLSAGDSFLIHIQTNIAPSELSELFVTEDSIEFITGNHTQYLKLITYGQNAYFHLADRMILLPNGESERGFYVSDKDPWPTDKPHIIFGTCLVKDCTLKLLPGTALHFAPGARLVIGSGGKIEAEGSLQLPVIFSGIRRDGLYRRGAGQWEGIWISNNSKDNMLDWCLIQNGTTGIYMDSNSNSSVKLNNTWIQSMLSIGLLSSDGEIKATNLLISDCQSSLQCNNKGNYQFTHCTFLTFSPDFRRPPAVVLSNENASFTSSFTNCIVYGNSYNELTISKKEGDNYLFKNCLIQKEESSQFNFIDCLFMKTPSFVNKEDRNYRPSKDSPVIGKGTMEGLTLAPLDLDSIQRLNPPSLGVYEFH